MHSPKSHGQAAATAAKPRTEFVLRFVQSSYTGKLGQWNPLFCVGRFVPSPGAWYEVPPQGHPVRVRRDYDDPDVRKASGLDLQEVRTHTVPPGKSVWSNPQNHMVIADRDNPAGDSDPIYVKIE